MKKEVDGNIIVPVYVNLNIIGAEKASHKLVQAIFGDMLGFSPIEIANFKKQTKYQIVLILDGYDEIFSDSSVNIYANSGMDKWISINLVIFTCRT